MHKGGARSFKTGFALFVRMHYMLFMDSQDSPPKHQRRQRYKGTHPRRFHEKYKELNPQKYKDDIEKIKNRGVTPVGTHRPICVREILQILNPQPGEKALDATLGYGGHSGELLKRLLPGGQLIALDQDPLERPKTEERLRSALSEEQQSSLVVGPINFSEAWNFLRQQGLGRMDMVLADLGLSSMQIDTPERGFSFKVDAPFDLRMNPHKGVPAWQKLQQLHVDELTQALRDNADEPAAAAIAEALIRKMPKTTFEVVRSLENVMSSWSAKKREAEGDAPIRRTFQAVRILVNDEFGVLDRFLEDIPQFLKPGGRVAILTFHSGEDRRVKKSFQAGLREGFYSAVADEPMRPSREEQRDNPRSSSAKLRWARR